MKKLVIVLALLALSLGVFANDNSPPKMMTRSVQITWGR